MLPQLGTDGSAIQTNSIFQVKSSLDKLASRHGQMWAQALTITDSLSVSFPHTGIATFACVGHSIIFASTSSIRASTVRPTIDPKAIVVVLTPITRVRATFTNTRSTQAATVLSTVDSMAGVVVLAMVTEVRATLTDALATRAAPMRPAVDAEAGVKVLAPVAGVRATFAKAGAV